LDLCFDEAQQCLLLFDDQMVSISSGADSWTFYGMVMELDRPRDDTFWYELLALNLSLLKQRAGGLASRSDVKALLYVDSVPMPVAVHEVYSRLERFVEYHQRVCDQLAAHAGRPEGQLVGVGLVR
jgi:hypothetical protein